MNSKKRVIIIISILVLLLGGLGVGLYLVQQNAENRSKAFPATTISITPATKAIRVGETFDMVVEMDSTVNLLSAATLEVDFDAQKLVLQTLIPGTFLPTQMGSPQVNNTTGVATIIQSAQPSNPAQGRGLLATLRFQAKAPGVVNLTFGPQTKAAGFTGSVNSANRDDVDVVQNRNPATVTVLATASPSPSPTPMVSPSPTATPRISPSPTASPTGGNSTPAPSPSPTGAAGGDSGSTKPTVNLPTSKTVKVGDTLTGTALVSSMVTIKIQSQTITASVKTDATGKWSYKIPSTLELGSHTITITDASGNSTTSTFTLVSANSPASSTTELPSSGIETPLIFGMAGGAFLLVLGVILAL